MFQRYLGFAFALPLCLGPVLPARPDTIYLADGTQLENVSITADTLAGLTYKQRGVEQQLPSDQVERVEYQRKPKQVQEAEVALQEDNIEGAIEDLELCRDGILGGNEKEQKAFPWAAEWASNRVVELRRANQDWAGTVAAANLLIEKFPESRNLPAAYLAKAEAESALDKEAAALSSLAGLAKLIGERSLSQRWQLEHDVSLATIDRSLDPRARLTKLEKVQKAAGGSAGGNAVLNRAELAMAEAYLALADADTAKRADHLAKARQLLEGINARPAVEERVLAGALMGMADASFQAATGSQDKAALAAARLLYMRVVVLYRGQSRYVPKALFQAATISKQLFDLTQDPSEAERQIKLATRLVSRYRGTSWADEGRVLMR
jgi:hypothetical protein